MRRPGVAREIGVHLLGAAFEDDADAIGDEDIFALHAEADEQVKAGERRSPAAAAGEPRFADVLADDLQRVQDRRRHHDGRAVLVVVHDRDFHALAQLLLDLEAFRRLDVFEVDGAERRLQRRDRVHEAVRVGGGHFDVEHVDACEFAEQHRLAFHDGLGGERADIAEAEHGGSVRNHADKVRAGGEPGRGGAVLRNLFAGESHARRIGERQVALRRKRLRRHDGELTRRIGLVIFDGAFLEIVRHDLSPPALLKRRVRRCIVNLKLERVAQFLARAKGACGSQKARAYTTAEDRRSQFRQAMTTEKAEETQAVYAPAQMPAMAERRPLTLTYALIAALTLVFAAEIAFPVEPASGFLEPSIRTLVAFGALDNRLVLEGGEWQRLFLAPVLHGSIAHIALNALALFFAGLILENAIGRAWFAAVFAVSGICGALMSLAINPASIVSVGASGAIMGLFAAAFSVSYRWPKASPMRRYLQSGSLRVLIPSMLPLFGGVFGEAIDYAAHAGGAIGGAALGAFLAIGWSKDAALPPCRKAAILAAALGLCGVAVAGFKVATDHEAYTLATYLIPADRLPNTPALWREKSAGLVKAYPRDPRSHMYRAMTLHDAGDKEGAEREWRAALSEGAMLRTFFKPGLERLIRSNLAFALNEYGKAAEARDVARPICDSEQEFREEFADDLCPQQ